MKTFKVGFRAGRLEDPFRTNWDGIPPRPIRWSAWYPAPSSVIEQDLAPSPHFLMGAVARDAPLVEDHDRFPLVLMSHGTGGTASSLGWLARRIAADGSIVIGIDHHGNTAAEPYRPEGFLCWWERAADLSAALDVLSTGGPFADRLDLDQVSAAGFSLGGYTVLALVGAITDMKLFREWSASRAVGRGPREFPDLADHIDQLLERNAVFRASWERQSESFLDRRIRCVIALAPAPTVHAFTLESLRAVKAPVTIAVGEGDTEAPASCSTWLHAHLPHSALHLLGPEVGHYALLCEGTAAGKEAEPEVWQDPPGVNRVAVHDRVADIVLAAIRAA